MKVPVNIALAFDATYAPYARVALQSILNTRSSSRELTFWLLTATDVESRYRNLVEQQTRNAARVHWLTAAVPDNLPDGDHTIPHVSQAMYLRLLLPQLIPTRVGAFLYLDCDILCTGPLDALFDTNLEGRAIGAVRDAETRRLLDGGGLPGLKDYDWLDPWALYFNSGVLLIDPDAWRSQRITETCHRYLRRHRDRARYADQDALNFAAYGNWRQLPATWNYMMPWRLESAVGGRLTNARICHMAGDYKAWNEDYPGTDIRAYYEQCRRDLPEEAVPRASGVNRTPQPLA